MRINNFSEFINSRSINKQVNEGGWSSVKTQNTTLTPAILKEVVSIFNKLGTDFNKHLASIDLPEIKVLRPVGSGTWWEEDLIDQPDKVYGDVDFMISYPTLPLGDGDERKDEIETVKLYNAELFKWLEKTKPSTVDIEESRDMSTSSSVKLLVTSDVEGNQIWVQVDMVVTHHDYADWALFRYTPVKNIKGFVLGSLYSGFGSVLDLSIQSRGVRAKFIKDVMVSQAKRKDVTERLISRNVQTFMYDIARFFWQQATTDPFEPSESLKGWSMDPNNPTLEDVAAGIHAVADTLEKIGEFGTVVKFKSKRELLDAVANVYAIKMDKTFNASKFDKAETPEAKKTIEKIRKLIVDSVAKVKQLLK